MYKVWHDIKLAHARFFFFDIVRPWAKVSTQQSLDVSHGKACCCFLFFAFLFFSFSFTSIVLIRISYNHLSFSIISSFLFDQLWFRLWSPSIFSLLLSHSWVFFTSPSSVYLILMLYIFATPPSIFFNFNLFFVSNFHCLTWSRLLMRSVIGNLKT